MLRPLGIDNTVIVDVFKTMTQAQIDLQTQLEQATPTDLITRPLSNDSPVLYIETSEQTPTFLEPMEHTKVENETSKPTPPQDDTDHTQSTPLPPKKRYEIMKDPISLSSPIYPPSIPSKISLCTNRDDHLISILSTDDFVFILYPSLRKIEILHLSCKFLTKNVIVARFLQDNASLARILQDDENLAR